MSSKRQTSTFITHLRFTKALEGIEACSEAVQRGSKLASGGAMDWAPLSFPGSLPLCLTPFSPHILKRPAVLQTLLPFMRRGLSL